MIDRITQGRMPCCSMSIEEINRHKHNRTVLLTCVLQATQEWNLLNRVLGSNMYASITIQHTRLVNLEYDAQLAIRAFDRTVQPLIESLTSLKSEIVDRLIKGRIANRLEERMLSEVARQLAHSLRDALINFLSSSGLRLVETLAPLTRWRHLELANITGIVIDLSGAVESIQQARKSLNAIQEQVELLRRTLNALDKSDAGLLLGIITYQVQVLTMERAALVNAYRLVADSRARLEGTPIGRRYVDLIGRQSLASECITRFMAALEGRLVYPIRADRPK